MERNYVTVALCIVRILMLCTATRRDNLSTRTMVRFAQARKATHGLDGQHQDVDSTLCGRVSQNDRGQ